MITSDEQLEVQEIELGTYVFPNSKKFAPSWALFVYKDGRAELFTKRDLEKGSLLGKPKDLGRPIIKIHPYDFIEFMKHIQTLDVVLKLDDKHREVHKINGQLYYYQTTSVPAQTKKYQ